MRLTDRRLTKASLNASSMWEPRNNNAGLGCEYYYINKNKTLLHGTITDFAKRHSTVHKER